MISVIVTPENGLLFFTSKRYGQGPVTIKFESKRSVKDLIESLGIPHVEVSEVLIDGETVKLSDLIEKSCGLEVHGPPSGMSAAVSEELPVFILDVHLGKLAVNLRMLGFKADYSRDCDDAELAALAATGEGECPAVLLSCDRGLMMRKQVTAGMVVRSRDPLRQTAEVLKRFGLCGRIRPFTRCFNVYT